MPIYEYQCNACHHTFDALQRMSDEPLKKCPECGQNTVDKLVSAAAFQLKGTGWYETDFKNQPKKTAENADKKEIKKSANTTKTAGSAD
ncbi:MAG: zinc ribbon domain-containing protein [Gammaproteobacteria bacterium]|nr:zinc ribbon domain-containing protein [Gammaproteobacteria bacterium]